MSSLPPARSPVTAEPAPARPPAQVRCRLRPGVTLTFTLKSDESLVGRDSGLAVAIPLDGVSRQHARIYWDGRAYWLEDLKSTNGTGLNDSSVKGSAPVYPGDLIRLGEVQLRLETDDVRA